jgi:GT2 family glycosyltransferase
MDSFSYGHTTEHMGETYDKMDVLAMFCLVISREAFNKIGYLEEIYGIGMFEDDDYSYKTRSLGYEIKCADDVFIHHYGNVSFKKLEDKTYMEIFNKNRNIFEERWNVEWKQHKWRPGVKN